MTRIYCALLFTGALFCFLPNEAGAKKHIISPVPSQTIHLSPATGSSISAISPICNRKKKVLKSQSFKKENNVISQFGLWIQGFFAQYFHFGEMPEEKNPYTDTITYTCDVSLPTPTASPSASITPLIKKAAIITPSAIPVVVTATPVSVAVRHGQIKLMPLGDSITDGGGGYRVDLWKRLVPGDKDDIDFVGSVSSGTPDLGDSDHEGHIGWRIEELDRSVGGWIAAYKPDIILLHIGTNDLNQGASAGTMTQQLSKLIGDIFTVKPDTYIVVSTLIPSQIGAGSEWSAYNASIPGVVAQYRNQGRKIIGLDMSRIVTADDLADGIHPNFSGYSKMANMWYPVVSTIYREYAGQSVH